MLVKIYGLVDPRDNTIRYVGKTRGKLNKRLCEHCQDRRHRHNRHKINWIKKLESLAMRPSIQLLEECEEAVWQERERDWIARLRPQLMNVDAGGNGSTYIGNRTLAAPQRQNISETLKVYYSKNPSARLACRTAGYSNRGVPKSIPNKRSRYCGVTFQERRGKPLSKPWRAMIVFDKVHYHCGYFTTDEEAARAYDEKAKSLGSKNLNFPG